MRRIASLLLLLVLGVPAFAGTSAVTATITDSDSQTWNNGTFQVSFVPTPGVPASAYNVNGVSFTQFFTGTMNGSGVLTVTLTDLSTVSPTGGQWRFTLCPNASASCSQVVTSAVVGATPNLSAQLSLGLAGPRFAATAFAFGYLDVEVSPLPAPGGEYFNVTSGSIRLWNGSVWSGAGSPGLSTLGPSFNVAVNYGCKPDGSTDNSTCIANAFAASNAVTGGVPTVYFPCVPGTGCQYNINAGAGLSPLNPVIPTAIKCDPEVTLNFTSGSTAHALDIGPTTTNSIAAASALANKGYSILYCRFTGGANITEGIFVNQYTPKVEIRGNTFFDFGNASSFSIWCQAECWWMNVQTNYEWNDDGVNHQFLFLNNSTGTIDDESYIANNLNVCVNAGNVVNCGVGYVLDGFFTIYSNDLAGHIPAIRVKNHTNGCHIFENVLEIDVTAAGNKAAIESNNAGTDTQCEVMGNNLYVGATTDSLIGVTGGTDVVTLWNVHDNWLRTDSAQGLLFNLNNLANQTSKIIARNNARFSAVTNVASNLTAVKVDDEGNNAFQISAGSIQMGPASSTASNSTLQQYNQISGATVGWSMGLNIPSAITTTSNLHFSFFNGSTWGDKWFMSGTTGNLEAQGLVGYTVGLTSTASITGPVPVKIDTGNAQQVVVTTTTDTAAGIVIGVCSNSPGAAQGCEVMTTGLQGLTLGTGTCAIGNFVIVDTTTNGRVKCTSTYTAGTVIGVAINAQNTVGQVVNVIIGLR